MSARKSDRRRRAGLFIQHAPPMTNWSEESIEFLFELPEMDAGNTGLAVVSKFRSTLLKLLGTQTQTVLCISSGDQRGAEPASEFSRK
jgi:hypothetical protein